VDVRDAILTRRSVRRYTAEPVPRELLTDVLSAALWAPSAHNRQPWRFAVSDDVATIERLARSMGDRLRRDLEVDGVPEPVIVADTGRSYARITDAAAVVALCLTMADMDVYPDERRSSLERVMASQSAAMAGQNLLLAAHAAELGACWMCAPLFCPDVVRAALDLPDDWEPQALITLGWPAETRTKDRALLETRVLWR
jgi:coenzyme F420-0:L-glutamate ligase/coenzyme F420-1:gamma-L-glutamate ligase